jgi:hypothetical protein
VYPVLTHLAAVELKRTLALDLPNPDLFLDFAVMFSMVMDLRTFLIVHELPFFLIVHFLFPTNTSLPVILFRDETTGNSIVIFRSTKFLLRKILSTTKILGLPGTLARCELAEASTGVIADVAATITAAIPSRRNVLISMFYLLVRSPLSYRSKVPIRCFG